MAGDVVCSGMSGRFPRSDTIDEFWDNLVNKVDMVTKDRVQEEFETYPTALATMKTLRKFDAAFFGASHTAADALGAAQRILYEVVYEAIMDAGKYLLTSLTHLITFCNSRIQSGNASRKEDRRLRRNMFTRSTVVNDHRQRLERSSNLGKLSTLEHRLIHVRLQGS